MSRGLGKIHVRAMTAAGLIAMPVAMLAGRRMRPRRRPG